MKNYRYAVSMLLTAAGALLAVPASWGQATNITVNTFDSGSEVTNNWTHWWGGAATTIQFDSTMDAGGNTNSGSMKVTVQFNLATNADNQFALRGALAGNGSLSGKVIDASQYTNLVFDLFWATNSPQRIYGDMGPLDTGLVPTDYSQDWLPTYTVPITNGWQHVVLPINPTANEIGKIGGVALKMWSGDSVWGQTGTATFWVDNVKLIAKIGPPPPPPSMSIQPTIPGLNLLASQTSGNNPQYQRQGIRTVASTLDNGFDYTWTEPNTGADGNGVRPVTYAVTITNYPGTNYAEYQTHIFLAPGNPTESEPDWSEANIIFLNIHNHANGTASATFQYKTNEPSGNTMLFNSQPGGQYGTNGWPQGVLGTVNSSNILGTWSMTFSDVTNVTITSSSGATNSFSIPDLSNLFFWPVTAYVGAQPNNLPAIGQTAVLSRFQIIGTVTPLDEDFTGAALDTTKWAVAADDAPGVVQVPPNAPYWVSMTLPAVGFNLQIGSNLTDTNSWTTPTLTSSGAVFGKQRFLVSSSVLPGPGTNTVFFRAVKTQ